MVHEDRRGVIATKMDLNPFALSLSKGIFMVRQAYHERACLFVVAKTLFSSFVVPVSTGMVDCYEDRLGALTLCKGEENSMFRASNHRNDIGGTQGIKHRHTATLYMQSGLEFPGMEKVPPREFESLSSA